jgi:hypothetical protein
MIFLFDYDAFIIVFWRFINLGYVLLCTTSDKKNKGLHLKTLLFSSIYRIQIVQNTTQLSSKGIFNQPPLFLIHWSSGSN